MWKERPAGCVGLWPPQGRNKVRWHPGQEAKFGAPVLETEFFRKQIYCIEESSCDIVRAFWRSSQPFGIPAVIWRPYSDSVPEDCAPVDPPPSLRPEPAVSLPHFCKVTRLSRTWGQQGHLLNHSILNLPCCKTKATFSGFRCWKEIRPEWSEFHSINNRVDFVRIKCVRSIHSL